MLSKLAGGSQREEKCNGECSHYNRPSRNLLQKEFATSVTVSNVEYFVCGNGPYILTGEYDLAPFTVTEITVFPQLQVTVRGIIPMSQEKCILAFGANYLAMVGFDQLKHGGHVCQSRIATTASLIVGGRRVGENKTFEVAKKKGSYAIAKRGAKKLNLQGAKVTAMLVSGPNVLLGTSTGQVISHAGKIYFKGDESKGAVRQMTVINEHIVLLLFQNKSLALLDLRYHALRSVVEGRFTAVESVFCSGIIMAGDLDGTLHSFKISPKGTQMRLRSSYKCIYRNAIICMFPIHEASLVCTTAMGSQFVVDRQRFTDNSDVISRRLDLGARLAWTTKDKCYFLKERKLCCVEGQLSANGLPAQTEVPDREFSQLKHYRLNDFEAVYAFGGCHFLSDVTHKKKLKRNILSLGERIITAVVTEDFLLIQQEKAIMIYSMQKNGWKPNVKGLWDGDLAKVSAFSKMALTHNFILFLIATQDGELYAGHIEDTFTSIKMMPLYSFSTFPNDFVVSMQTWGERVYVLTAKAKLHIYMLCPGNKNGVSDENTGYKELLSEENVTSYKHPLGRGYDILVIDKGIYLVGFKQKMLNVYKVGDQQVLSLPTRGPRSSYAIHECSESSMIATCGAGAGGITRIFPKKFRVHRAEMKHSGPVTHVLFMCEFAVECWRGVFADIVTGDCNGLVALMGVTASAACSQVFTRMTHQMNGAITSMARNAQYLFVGTSTGALVVFQYINANLFPCLKLQYSYAVTNILCNPNDPPKGALVGLANGWEDVILYTKAGYMESKGVMETHELLEDIKWSWVDVSADGRVLSLSKDGILYRTVAPLPTPPYRIRGVVRSIDFSTGQKYNYFKNIRLADGYTGLIAGYYDGMFLFAVYREECKGWMYFAADSIHRHEIIDSIFYQTPSNSAIIWSLATLDKSGLYVQRTWTCDSKGIKILGLPMKWYCPVRHPKAMVFLEKRKEVLVVGSGLATLVLKSLAPPPPSPTSATDCDGLFCDIPLD